MRQKMRQRDHSSKWLSSIILIKIQPHVHFSFLQDQDSKQVFHKVSEAYNTLSDPIKRSAYDQKQSFLNKPRKEFDFKEPTMYFYKSSGPFYSQFEKQFRWSSFEYARKRAAEERMDDKARHERQQLKKQHNQKNKNQYKENANPFFRKENTASQKSPREQKFFEKEQEKDIPKKKENIFSFQKSIFKKTNENRSEFQEMRNDRERKARLQKEAMKARKNIWMFMVFIGIMILWISLDYYGPSMRGVPVYSISQSSTHKIPQFTKELNSPFFVTQDYIQRAKADDRFREHIDKKIDFAYIKLVSRMCNSVKKKEEELNDNLDVAKSIKSRTQIVQKSKELNFSPCLQVHNIRQRNHVYFKSLFIDPKNEL